MRAAIPGAAVHVEDKFQLGCHSRGELVTSELQVDNVGDVNITYSWSVSAPFRMMNETQQVILPGQRQSTGIQVVCHVRDTFDRVQRWI